MATMENRIAAQLSNLGHTIDESTPETQSRLAELRSLIDNATKMQPRVGRKVCASEVSAAIPLTLSPSIPAITPASAPSYRDQPSSAAIVAEYDDDWTMAILPHIGQNSPDLPTEQLMRIVAGVEIDATDSDDSASTPASTPRLQAHFPADHNAAHESDASVKGSSPMASGDADCDRETDVDDESDVSSTAKSRRQLLTAALSETQIQDGSEANSDNEYDSASSRDAGVHTGEGIGRWRTEGSSTHGRLGPSFSHHESCRSFPLDSQRSDDKRESDVPNPG